MKALDVLLRALHLDEPAVSEEQRAEVVELREQAAGLAEVAARRARQSVGVARYFRRVNDQNHFAERIAAARRGN